MTSPALLLLAACALVAPLHAASIPDLQKKIPSALPEDIKDPAPPTLEVVPEPADLPTNELRAKPEDIPVEVVVENVEPSVKLNEVDEEEIQRPAVDLRNPGPPQRQEHETQNPERHSDEELKVSTIKESIEQTQQLLKQSFQDVADNIQNWYVKGDDQNKVQKNIENLREVFTGQISKLRSKIESLVESEAPEAAEPHGVASQRNYKKIQTHLKSLEDKFNNDVETLSEGIELIGTLRADAEEPIKDEASESVAPPAPPAPAAPVAPTAPPGNIAGFVSNAINALSQQWNATLTNFQNMLTPQAPAGAQSDEPAASGTPWLGNLQIPNIQNAISTLQGAFSNFTQNLNQNFNGFTANIFNRPPSSGGASSPAADKPTKEKPEVAANKPEAAANKPAAADKPADAAAPAQAAQPAQPDAGGPIRQFLNSIPVVQRIQNTIANRDTPRNPPDDAQKPEGQTKGGWFPPPRPPPNHGDNNDVDSGVSKLKSEELKEPVKEEPIKKEPVKVEPIKKESVKEEPVKEKPVEKAPVKEEPVKEEPIKEEPIKEEIKKVEPELVPEKTE